MKTLAERDKKHLWHPLTQHKTKGEMLAISKAKGAYIYDEDGKEYIDGIASWYTCMYGHCNPYITDKISAQLQELDHVVFTGFTHKPAIELSEKLMAILPKNQEKLFFSDNGSTTVDVAIKMALQYNHNKGIPKTTILALEEGFHGDTFGAMSVSGLSVYNGPFEEHFIDVVRIPTPSETTIDKILTQVEILLKDKNIAAFIYEPLVQGAAAMKMHSAAAINPLLKYLKENDVLLIADEVMTGFGKTGTYFASYQIETPPDIICLSKSLSAGIAPMGITSCSQEVFDAFYDDDIAKGFFHGHTYSGNPLACTAAIAGIELLTSEAYQEHSKRIIAKHQAFDQRISKHPKVKETRQTGLIFALEIATKMERYGSIRDQLFNAFMERGVFLRPLGNVIYILTPFITSNEDLEKIYSSIEEVLEIV